MKAYIITIGDEILIGQIVDTNSSWIASELTKIGFSITQIRSISDNEKAIETTISESFEQADLIVLTGGLGPTKDDITKNTLARFFNSKLVFNELVYADVVDFINRRGSKMNTLNRDQALFPENAIVLHNKNGTAPGIWFEKDNKVLVSLPGVPSEMKSLMNEKVIPNIGVHFKLPAFVHKTAIVTEIGESQLALKLEDWENNLPQDIKLAYLPSPGIVRLRLSTIASTKIDAEFVLNQELQKLTKLISNNIVSLEDESLQVVIGKLLKANNKTLSVAESCTGGNIAHLLTTIPGASNYFKGGVIAYSNEIKENILGIPKSTIIEYGAVSQQVVEQMAMGALSLFKTNFAIATSGIAGPDGGSKEKPVGSVWIAVAQANMVTSKLFHFGNERTINISRSSNAALNLLRKIILALK